MLKVFGTCLKFLTQELQNQLDFIIKISLTKYLHFEKIKLAVEGKREFAGAL